MADDQDMWGDDDDDLFLHIEETDYYEYRSGAVPANPGNNDSAMFDSEMEILDPVLAHHQNISELRSEVTTLQRKLEETVLLNTELKDRNYELQGEAGTLRRRLDQQNATKQQLLFEKIQNMKDTKQKEEEGRKELLKEIDLLKSQLHLSRVDVHNLEERNRQIARRQSLGKSFSNPAFGPMPSQSQTVSLGISPPHSLPAPPASQYLQHPPMNDKMSFPNRNSFFAKEVHSQQLQLPISSIVIETESKEVQTEEVRFVKPALHPSSQTSSTYNDEDECRAEKCLSSSQLYADIKDSMRRLITVEIQMLQPIIEKTLRYVPFAFKRRIKYKTPRFGLGFEAFDATALMLQWMDEKEMEQFQETEDMQAEYSKRMDEIYNSANKENLQYPPASCEIENYSENWPDSEQMVNSSSDEELDRVIEGEAPSQSFSQSQLNPGEQSSLVESRDSDTSEDEYDLADPTPSIQVTSAKFESTATQTQQPQMDTVANQRSTTQERKRLTFFKEYKLKSKLLKDRNCYKYIKYGQPMKVVSEILEGLYESGPAIWNTLYFIKNELRFILDRGDLYDTNRLHVFMTLLVWAKNLWSVVSAVAEEERPKLNKDWDTELFGWTELITAVVWRSSRSLTDICRELRSIFLQTILRVVESGYFEVEKENYSRLFFTIQDCVKNSTHHSPLNAQLLLDILVVLPRSHLLPFFCRRTVPFEISLPNCFLLELSHRVRDTFQQDPSISLFDRYLDLLQKLGNSQPEFYVIPSKFKSKRKLSDQEEMEEERSWRNRSMSADSMSSILDLSPPNIFKETEKCPCHIAAVSNFLLILSKTFSLWRERFRDIELQRLLKNDQGIESQINIYTDILVRSFELIYTLYKHSDNLGTSYSPDVSTYFWEIVASYKRFRQHFAFRPDLHAMLLHMTVDGDGEDKRRTENGQVTFPPFFDQQWLQVVSKFPELNVEPSSVSLSQVQSAAV